jgi:hypothetical protein
MSSTGGLFMIVGAPREIYPGERRVALVPGVIPSQTKAGMEVFIESGAGASAGFAGIDNPLYYSDKTLMLVGDAKSFVGCIVREISGEQGTSLFTPWRKPIRECSLRGLRSKQ